MHLVFATWMRYEVYHKQGEVSTIYSYSGLPPTHDFVDIGRRTLHTYTRAIRCVPLAFSRQLIDHDVSPTHDFDLIWKNCRFATTVEQGDASMQKLLKAYAPKNPSSSCCGSADKGQLAAVSNPNERRAKTAGGAGSGDGGGRFCCFSRLCGASAGER